MECRTQYRQVIGGNLQRLRCRSGWSQQELCHELEQYAYPIKRSTYAKYETGELSAGAEVLALLQELYHCPFDEFFSGIAVQEAGVRETIF